VRLVLLGDPVAHSRSPAIWAAALGAAGIGGTYEARPVDAAGVAGAVAEIREGSLDGANVTMPHKELAAALADRGTAEVTRCEAANTLVAEGRHIVAHNTDVLGVRALWEARTLPSDAPVLILGAGGAAAAVLVAVGDQECFISARHPRAAEAVGERVGGSATVVPWGHAVTGAVVVNATPLGMHGEELPTGLVEQAGGLYDLAYGDRPTPAIETAHRLGLPAVDGLDHLVAQAAGSFEIWVGMAAPIAAMVGAVRMG
jgi:shikimate dehydrogenase